jgi:hypothetical protein
MNASVSNATVVVSELSNPDPVISLDSKCADFLTYMAH